MANLILGFPNQIDATFYPVTFSGGAWLSELPLENLTDPRLAKVARSADASLDSTWFDVDLGVGRATRLFVIPRSNLSREARIRIRCSDTAGDFAAPVYDTGWLDVWTQIYGWGSIPWEHPSFWDHKLSAEEAADYDIAFIHVAPAEQFARYERWEIDDTGNPAGYVELARLFVSPGWQPPKNMRYGARLGVKITTHVEESLGNVDYYDRHRPRRVALFTIGNLPRDTALAQAFEMQRRLGVDRQLYLVMDPEDVGNLHRTSFLATMREPDPIEFPHLDLADAAYHLLEV